MCVAGRSVAQLTLDSFGIVDRCHMGEPSIAYLVYRVLDDVKGRTAGFDDSLRTLVASFHSPGRAGNPRTFRRDLLSPRASAAVSNLFPYDKL
jgi:hypothetical protein